MAEPSKSQQIPSNTQGPIEPDTIRVDDEEYQTSSNESLLSSLASEVKQGRIKHGRVFATFGENEYGLPMDEQELDRLDMAHAKYHIMLGNRHYLAPIGPTKPKRILDIGTGTGIWAIELADEFPEAEVIGTDIAPCQPQWVPPNCSFQIDDAEQDWTFPKDSFDFIHQRDSLQGIRNWPKFAKQCFEHLKPGGYVEWSSIYIHAQSDDGTLPEGAALIELVDTFNELTRKIGADPLYPTKLKGWLAEAGFEDVVETVYKMPSSPWAKDPTMKKVGAFEYLNIVEGAQGFLIHGYKDWMGRSLEDLEELVGRLRRELGRNKQHSYVQFYVVYARKPEKK